MEFLDQLKSWLLGNKESNAPGAFSRLGSTALDTTENGITKQGWLSPTLTGVAGAGSLFTGLKSYGLAKDQFKEDKRRYNQEYANQAKLINSDLADRQATRIASNAGTPTTSVADYLAKYGVN